MPAVFPNGTGKAIIGMVHLPPLPGTPFHEDGSLQSIVDRAVRSARALRDGGADGCLLQTVDRVYRVDDESDPARTVAMALVAEAVWAATGEGFHVGVQLMRNALRASLAVAVLTGGSFIRAGALVGATMTAHGLVEAHPHDVMDYRRRIGAGHVRVFAEVDSPHFQWHGGTVPTPTVARHARLVGADAVVLGGWDEERTLATVAAVRKELPDLPIVLAGGTHHGNAARMLAAADGAFVGTCLERDGWGGEIDVDRVAEYVAIVREGTRAS